MIGVLFREAASLTALALFIAMLGVWSGIATGAL